jgi:hypothetical protein
MAFPDNNLHQTAVYWGNPASDGYGGYTWDDPVEIDCRWVRRTRLVKNAQGKEVVSNASVQVDQDVDLDGYLYLGDLDDLDSDEEANPMKVDGAYKILAFDKTPTILGEAYFRIAYL